MLSLCLALYSPFVAKRQLSLLLELKKMTSNHPATNEMGKPFMLIYLAAGSVAVVEAMAKTKSEKEKANGRGRSREKEKE